MSDLVKNMIADAMRRRKEVEEEEERQQREESLPPPNRILGGPLEDGSEDGERESSQAVATPSRRRRRSPSMDQDTPEERQRKYATFAEGECDRFALRGSRRNLLMSFSESDQHEKLISLMAFLQRNETDQANSEVRAYLASPAFKTHAVLLLWTAMVAPNVKGYVNSLAHFIEEDMARDPALYKIKKVIMEDEESRGMLNTQVRAKLTGLRNTIKDKLEAAVGNGHCMNQLMLDITPKQIEVTIEHRQRWAWVLSRYRTYRDNNSNTNGFWKDLDKLMSNFNVELSKNPELTSKRAQDAIKTQMYATALEEQEKNYPTQVPPAPPVDPPSWQIMLERNLLRYINSRIELST